MYNHSLGYQISRGIHDVNFLFEGELFYLPSNTNITTYVKSDISIELSPITHTIIRSSENQPIKIQGFVREIGGQFNVFENLTHKLYSGESALPFRNDPWASSGTLNFQIISSAREFMEPGINNLEQLIQADEALKINGASINLD